MAAPTFEDVERACSDWTAEALPDVDREIDDGRFMLFVAPSGRGRPTEEAVVRLAVVEGVGSYR